MVPVNFASFYDSTPNSLSPLNRTISCLGAPSILASANDSTSLCSNERRLYRTFEITRPIFSNLLLSSPPRPHSTFLNASTPVFYVKNNGYRQYGPCVTLTDKTRDGEVLGFVKSRWGRSDLFGLGPCATFITWQKLRRASYTSYSRFEFVFNFGPTGGGRRKFIWRCQFLGGFIDQPNMVLHEIVGWGVRGSWGRESPELLAIYDGIQCIGLRTERKGKLRIKRGVIRGEVELFHGPEEKEEDSEGDWEKVVILTAMAIVETTRRWYSKGSDPTEQKP